MLLLLLLLSLWLLLFVFAVVFVVVVGVVVLVVAAAVSVAVAVGVVLVLVVLVVVLVGFLVFVLAVVVVLVLAVVGLCCFLHDSIGETYGPWVPTNTAAVATAGHSPWSVDDLCTSRCGNNKAVVTDRALRSPRRAGPTRTLRCEGCTASGLTLCV